MEGELPRLGRLAAEGYSFSPSPTEMLLINERDPHRLERQHNFTVTREGVGSIHWRSPVNVTRLDLDKIIVIQQGGFFFRGGWGGAVYD